MTPTLKTPAVPGCVLLRARMSSSSGEQNSFNALTKEKAAEIAADFMTAFYHVQVGALETQEFRRTPVPFWLILLLGHDQTSIATNVFRRTTT